MTASAPRRRTRRLRVLALMHEDFVPPETPGERGAREKRAAQTETNVMNAIRSLGHDVRALGVRDELLPIRWTNDQWSPHIVFNLLEEFQGEAVYDHSVVSYLELLGLPYTGCNPRALVLARDKALAKKIVHYHRIRTPRFAVARRGRKLRAPRSLQFPVIVKSLWEDASLGIAKASVVQSAEKLAERVTLIHERVGTDAILEEFVPGREIYVGVLGNQRLQVLPPMELVVAGQDPETFVATARLKHDAAYQKKHGVKIRVARDLGADVLKALERTSRRIYRALEFSGYGRVDFRMDASGRLFFLEANPNPEIARDEELATAARRAGLSYEDLIRKVLSLGLRRASRSGAGEA